MLNSTRYKYLDWAKGFGILLIIIAHCIQYFPSTRVVCKYISSFHVPIFFVVSGCLAYYKRGTSYNFDVFIKKRTKALLIPYAIFSLFNSLLKFIVLFFDDGLTMKIIKSELIQLFITGNGTVWFLSTLFFVEIIYWCIKRLGLSNTNNRLYLYFITIIFLVSPYFLQAIVNNPFGIFFVRGLGGAGCYLIGFFVANIIERMQNERQIFVICSALIVCGLLAYCIYGHRSGYVNAVFLDMPASIVCNIASSTGFIMLFRYFELEQYDLKVISYFGMNSLITMLVHPTVLLMFTYPFEKVFL